MFIAMRKEKPSKYMDKIADYTIKCKCGHSVIFPNKEDRIVCGWCGHYVYKNDKAKFKYKLKEEMNKKMKITFYELLGLVKDGKAPKKIKFGNIELEYDEKDEDYYSYYGGGLFEHKFGNCKNFLNDEVEIIKENKKIEYIEVEVETLYSVADGIACKKVSIDNEKLAKKINELIDEINNLKEND